jgi:hypothetical protein
MKKRPPTAPKAAGIPAAKKKPAIDPLDEIPRHLSFLDDYEVCTHARPVGGINTQIVTAKIFVQQSEPSSYVPVIHPSGEYLDIKWTTPEWHRRAQMMKNGYDAMYRAAGVAEDDVPEMHGDKLTAYRDACEKTTNQFSDGRVVKTMRIKLSDPVKTDVGFATVEGPRGYPGYALELQRVPNSNLRISVLTVDMYGKKPPPNKPPVATPFYSSDADNGDDSDDDRKPRGKKDNSRRSMQT